MEAVTILCRQCETAIPLETIDQERRFVKCPRCAALARLADQPALPWPEALLPKGLRLKALEDELTITCSWWQLKYLFWGLFCLVWNGGLLSGFLGGMNYFICLLPHSWLGLGLFYYVLTGFFNRTVVAVTPDQLSINHGPLPWFGNKQLDPMMLKQLYVQERTHRNKGQRYYSYEVHMVTVDGRNQKLVGSLGSPDQAFFLEQEIERFMGIKDQPVPGEFGMTAAYLYRGINWNSWEMLAKAHKLTFTRGKLLGNYRVFGHYRGYHLELMALQKDGQAFPAMRMVLKGDQLQLDEPDSKKRSLSSQKVAVLFEALKSDHMLNGAFQVTPDGQEISYEQSNLETKERSLQFLFDSLHELISAYPKIVALGGEVIPILQNVAATASHPAWPVAAQLLKEVAAATLLLRSKISVLICRSCLVHYTVHELNIPHVNRFAFYGCRVCGQSRRFYEVEQVVAVLDQQMAAQPTLQAQTLRVNWLACRSLFDFDRVEIIAASDEEVERFAVQVGNDTDPARQSGYKTMTCLVAEGCDLSSNTIRVLQQILGQVTVHHK